MSDECVGLIFIKPVKLSFGALAGISVFIRQQSLFSSNGNRKVLLVENKVDEIS